MPEALLLSSGRGSTNDPAVANGAVAELSLTAQGRLRVDNTAVTAVAEAADPSFAEGAVSRLSQTRAGRLRVDVPAHGITGTVTVQGTATTTPAAGTSYTATSTAGTNGASLKSTAGSLFELSVFNPTAAVVYVKLYNLSPAPTVGTSVPILTIPVAVNGYQAIDFGALGKRFSAGISIAITAGPLATDTAAVAAGVQVSGTYL